jgi:hypothetical protein
LAAIYHIIKPTAVTDITNGSNVTTDSEATVGSPPADYYHGYSAFLNAYEKGNPPANSPLPPGNWGNIGKAKY